MMWLTFLAGLAMAQDDASRNLRLLGDAPETAGATQATGAPVYAPVVATPAPVQAPVSAPAPVASVSSPFGAGFFWNFGGPLALLAVVGGAAWWVRKNGLPMRGANRMGFAGGTDGPSIEVCSRTPLAGNDVLAVVEVQGFGRARHLLVAAGPGGSQLIADLSPTSGQNPSAGAAPSPVTADAIAAAVQASLGTAWTHPQAPSAPPAPVAAYAAPTTHGAAPVAHGTAPVHGTAAQGPATAAPEPAPAPRPIPTPVVDVRVDTPAPPEPRADDARPQGIQDDLDFAVELQDSMDAVDVDIRPERRRERSALGGRRDWRTAAYTGADEFTEERPRETRPTSSRSRGGEPRRAPPRARRMDDRRSGTGADPATRGHLEQLVRRRDGASESGGRLRTDARSRRERTQAARALLEQVMARREKEDRR